MLSAETNRTLLVVAHMVVVLGGAVALFLDTVSKTNQNIHLHKLYLNAKLLATKCHLP